MINYHAVLETDVGYEDNLQSVLDTQNSIIRLTIREYIYISIYNRLHDVCLKSVTIREAFQKKKIIENSIFRGGEEFGSDVKFHNCKNTVYFNSNT